MFVVFICVCPFVCYPVDRANGGRKIIGLVIESGGERLKWCLVTRFIAWTQSSTTSGPASCEQE